MKTKFKHASAVHQSLFSFIYFVTSEMPSPNIKVSKTSKILLEELLRFKVKKI